MTPRERNLLQGLMLLSSMVTLIWWAHQSGNRGNGAALFALLPIVPP